MSVPLPLRERVAGGARRVRGRTALAGQGFQPLIRPSSDGHLLPPGEKGPRGGIRYCGVTLVVVVTEAEDVAGAVVVVVVRRFTLVWVE